MPKEFFTDWETWEKLVLILACAIVVTVFLGCVKLVYSHWRLRKYMAVAEKEKKEQAMHRQMSQRRRALEHQKKDDVPFGIRALESGIEVEGVWISRSNTPEPMSRDTSEVSSMWEHVMRRSSEPDLERQDPRQARTRSLSSSGGGATRPNSVVNDRCVSADKVPDSKLTRDSSPEHAIAKPTRARHPPLSYTRYNGHSYIPRPSSTINTMEGLDAIHKASTSIHGDGGTSDSDSSNQSSESTDDSGPISASAPALLTAATRQKRRDQRPSDLDLLNSHRISQAAEVGQFTPRGRRAGSSCSVDLTPTARYGRQFASAEHSDYFSLQAKTAPPTPGHGFPANPFSTPKIDALPPAVRRSSMPDVTPFAEFCKRTSRNAPPESCRSTSRDGVPSASPRRGNESPQNSAPSSPIIPASEGAAEMKLPRPKRGSFEKRISQVIRGEGTGFEILRPGSLNPAIPKEHSMERQRAMPPISLQNVSRTRTSSVGSRSKLQKKQRSSLDSTTSSESSRQSRRISLFG